MEIIQQGSDALDGVIAGVNINENDPNDVSVGYGGLPNEDGVVELDSAVMHGPNHMAGAVASLRNIKNPSKVARMVMERTDHVLLVDALAGAPGPVMPRSSGSISIPRKRRSKKY